MLGQGTYGQVYPARQGVVVKRLRRAISSHPHAVLVEAWLLHKYRHPHVVRGLGVRCRGDAHLELYMEDAGIPLDKALRRRRASTLPLLAQMLDGLAHLHAHGIMHRDLKPDNILVDAHGHARIADMGAAAVVGTPLGQVHRVTSLCYRSPEMLRRHPYDTSSDMWAMGCVLVNMIEIEQEWVQHPPPLFYHPAAAAAQEGSKTEEDAQLRCIIVELVRLHAQPTLEDPRGLRAGVAAVQQQAKEEDCPLRGWTSVTAHTFDEGPRLFPSAPPRWIQQLVLPLLRLAPARRAKARQLRQHPLLRRFSQETAPEESPSAQEMPARDLRTLRRLCSVSTRTARSTVQDCWIDLHKI